MTRFSLFVKRSTETVPSALAPIPPIMHSASSGILEEKDNKRQHQLESPVSLAGVEGEIAVCFSRMLHSGSC